MIVLDYRLDPSWRTPDLSGLTVSDLRYDAFLGDVSFVVGSADFSTRWGWVPVLDFALGLRHEAQEALGVGRGRFDFTESEAHIDIRRDGAQAHVTADYVDGAGVAEVRALLAATEAFVARVVTELERRHPELRSNAAFTAIR